MNAIPDFEDPFQPPPVVCLVRCLHCDEVYRSDRIVWDSVRELWSCPVPDCGGAGFGFDIWVASKGSVTTFEGVV